MNLRAIFRRCSPLFHLLHAALCATVLTLALPIAGAQADQPLAASGRLENQAASQANAPDTYCLHSVDRSQIPALGQCSTSNRYGWTAESYPDGVLLKNALKSADGSWQCLINVGWEPRLGVCDLNRKESFWLMRDVSDGYVRLQNAYPSEARCLDTRDGRVVLQTCTDVAQGSALWSSDIMPRLPPSPYIQANPSAFAQPRSRLFAVLPDAAAEQVRLRQRMKWPDWQPTGFYLNPFSELDITVSPYTGATLELVIGTPSLVHPWAVEQSEPHPVHIRLTPGTQRVSSPRGGLISVRYVVDSIDKHAPDVTVTLGAQAQPVPFWVQGTTSVTQWRTMLQASTIPLVQLTSSRAVVTGTLQSALQSCPDDAQALMTTYDLGVTAQDVTAGLDYSAPAHRVSPLRPLLVETRSGTNPNASDYRGAMPYPWAGMFCNHNLQQDWGIWHELGHQRQSPIMMWHPGSLSEVTVNIYTLAAMRAWFTGPLPAGMPDATYWDKAVVYLHAPYDDREFENLGKTENVITLSMFEQMRLAFGKAFYPRLERALRTLPDPASEAGRKKMFQVEASEAASANLTSYFQQWGLRPDASTVSAIASLGLPAVGTSAYLTPVFGGSNNPQIIDLWGFWLPNGNLYVDGHATANSNIELIDIMGNLPEVATSDQHLAFVNDHLSKGYLEDGETRLKARIEGRPTTEKTATVVTYPIVTQLSASRRPDGSIRLTGKGSPAGALIAVHNQDGSWPHVASIGSDGQFENTGLRDYHMEDGRTTFVVRVEYQGRAFKERFTTQLVAMPVAEDKQTP